MNKLLLGDFGKFLQWYTSVNIFSDVTSKLFILETFQWPETEITWVKNEDIFQESFFILFDSMMFKFIELFVMIFFSKFLYVSFVDFDMFGTIDNELWSLSD